MDHVVFVSRSGKELEKLFSGERTMILRGSQGKKVPYGKINTGDNLFFATGNGRNVVKGTAVVTDVFDTPKLAPEEVVETLSENECKLCLSEDEREKWSGKKYLTLVEVENSSPIVPFTIAAHGSGENDDWVVIDDIDDITE